MTKQSKGKSRVQTTQAAAVQQEIPAPQSAQVVRLTQRGAWSDAQVGAKAAEYFSGSQVARNAVRELAAAYVADLVTAAQINVIWVTHMEDDSGRKFVSDFKEACALLKSSSKQAETYKTIQMGRGKDANTVVEHNAPKSRNVKRTTMDSLAKKVRKFALELKSVEQVAKFKALIDKQFEEIENGATK